MTDLEALGTLLAVLERPDPDGPRFGAIYALRKAWGSGAAYRTDRKFDDILKKWITIEKIDQFFTRFAAGDNAVFEHGDGQRESCVAIVSPEETGDHFVTLLWRNPDEDIPEAAGLVFLVRLDGRIISSPRITLNAERRETSFVEWEFCPQLPADDVLKEYVAAMQAMITYIDVQIEHDRKTGSYGDGVQYLLNMGLAGGWY